MCDRIRLIVHWLREPERGVQEEIADKKFNQRDLWILNGKYVAILLFSVLNDINQEIYVNCVLLSLIAESAVELLLLQLLTAIPALCHLW